jgi:RimJ/RimL family protein N-acetyltransferase
MNVFPPPTIDASPWAIRRYGSGDVPHLMEAVSTSLDHLRPWATWASATPLEPSLAEFIERSIEQFAVGEDFQYGIWVPEAPLLVGGSGLHPRLGPGQIEIGYWVRDGWLNRGIATAAARALTSAALTMPGIEEVHIHCDEANVASAAVPRRLGYRLSRIVDNKAHAPAEIGRSMEWVVSRTDWT